MNVAAFFYLSSFGVCCDFSAIFSDCFFTHTVRVMWRSRNDSNIYMSTVSNMEIMLSPKISYSFASITQNKRESRFPPFKYYTIPHNIHVLLEYNSHNHRFMYMNPQLGDTVWYIWKEYDFDTFDTSIWMLLWYVVFVNGIVLILANNIHTSSLLLFVVDCSICDNIFAFCQCHCVSLACKYSCVSEFFFVPQPQPIYTPILWWFATCFLFYRIVPTILN